MTGDRYNEYQSFIRRYQIDAQRSISIHPDSTDKAVGTGTKYFGCYKGDRRTCTKVKCHPN